MGGTGHRLASTTITVAGVAAIIATLLSSMYASFPFSFRRSQCILVNRANEDFAAVQSSYKRKTSTQHLGLSNVELSLIPRLEKTTENHFSSDMSFEYYSCMSISLVRPMLLADETCGRKGSRLLRVPIYAISSWTSMISITASHFLDPIRDIYEVRWHQIQIYNELGEGFKLLHMANVTRQAFTIYTFFQLLINYIGGERALIIMMHGRAPVNHLWPLNHVLPKVDISDPHTFLAIKRGILQYTWLKPLLALSAIIMKACGVYEEGYIGLKSGYFWSGIIYNISVTVSLYALGLFWVCMHHDLKPFRPVPKFLCIKLIIFASYWQGFFLSILVWVGAIPDNVEGYTPDNLAAAIQDALICIEMPAFAIAHWYAFSWKDFADNSIFSARMPLRHAFKDAFGPKDLIEDSKQTFMGDNYGYRSFDSGDKIIAHEDSQSRLARIKAGMRYERGGKGKYWIPKPGESQASATTPLLGPAFAGSSRNGGPSSDSGSSSFSEDVNLDPEEERLYGKARELEYGDWNVRRDSTPPPLNNDRTANPSPSIRSLLRANLCTPGI